MSLFLLHIFKQRVRFHFCIFNFRLAALQNSNFQFNVHSRLWTFCSPFIQTSLPLHSYNQFHHTAMFFHEICCALLRLNMYTAHHKY